MCCLTLGLDPETTLPEDLALLNKDDNGDYIISKEFERCITWRSGEISQEKADREQAAKERRNVRRQTRNRSRYQ